MGIPIYSIVMTRQTSLGAFAGIVSAHGKYLPTNFRKAYESGGIFLIDEINAADPNLLLVLNSLRNGYFPFNDGYMEPPHKDFRLAATSNPNDKYYSQRDELDKSTSNRFVKVKIDQDNELMSKLLSLNARMALSVANRELKNMGYNHTLGLSHGLQLDNIIGIGRDTSEAIGLLLSSYDNVLVSMIIEKTEVELENEIRKKVKIDKATSFRDISDILGP
jgi:hypothetical protein